MLNSEKKEFNDKIRQLKEEMDLIHTKTLQSVTRIINTADYLDVNQKEKLLEEIWK